MTADEESTRPTPLPSRPASVAAPGSRVLAVREAMAVLNALSTGELSRMASEMLRARELVALLGEPEITARLDEGRAFLLAGQLKEFRRALANVTSRLGHLK